MDESKRHRQFLTLVKAKIKQFRVELESELENILAYWRNRMVDNVYGGFLGRRDGYDRVEEKAGKGVILNTRILWTFSHAARTGSPDHQTLADRAFEYLVNAFIDHRNGGVIWMVDHLGKPVNTKKQIYAQAFAIYALAEYCLLTNDENVRKRAIDLFRLVEQYSFDNAHHGYFEAFDSSWNLLQDLRLSDKDANEKKTMNTHLHILEAYTNLYRCWPDPDLRDQITNLIVVFRDRILDGDHFGLFFDEKWNRKDEGISYGHDIEGSWLLYEAAEVLGDKDLLAQCSGIAVRMVDAVVREGLDADGAVRNESHDAAKHWWPQAEAMVGLVNAFRLTGDEKYLEISLRVWAFIRNRLIDRKNGEWYWGVGEKGELLFNEDKAGPWKCPYHNGRALMELLTRLPR